MRESRVQKRKKSSSAVQVIVLSLLAVLLLVLAVPLLLEYSPVEILRRISGEETGHTWSEGLTEFTAPADLESAVQARREALPGKLSYVRKEYAIPEGAGAGYVPDERCYGETDDPAEIRKLLNSAYAKQLIGDQETVWNEELPLIEGATLKYYLDESILVLVWNEPVGNCWGTFSEVFVSDASQLRRKIVQDSFDCNQYDYPSELAKEVNAVCASSADLYDHWSRVTGVCVYEGKLERFVPSCDVCFVTEEGDFILKKANSFTDEKAAEAFIAENNISFSLCFGPVLISEGEDVCPGFYPFGEIGDNYPRLAIAQMGTLHYLTVAVNANSAYSEYSKWGCTLRELTDVMLDHDCPNAYTLDGGQTGVIILDGQVVNPMQYNSEQIVSDIIYFATAIPEK